jgi:hypothetical protein
MADPLETACSLVGRFQYHFGRVEQKIDQAVIKLLDLDEKAGPIVTGSVAFASKVNFVRTSAYQQAVNEEDKKLAEKACDDVFACLSSEFLRQRAVPIKGGSGSFSG